MIADPPVLVGAVHVTDSRVLRLAATTDVGAPGTVAPTSEVAVTCAVPPVYPVRVVVIVAVELVPGATPVTVTKPELSMATKPDTVAVPAHV